MSSFNCSFMPSNFGLKNSEANYKITTKPGMALAIDQKFFDSESENNNHTSKDLDSNGPLNYDASNLDEKMCVSEDTCDVDNQCSLSNEQLLNDNYYLISEDHIQNSKTFKKSLSPEVKFNSFELIQRKNAIIALSDEKHKNGEWPSLNNEQIKDLILNSDNQFMIVTISYDVNTFSFCLEFIFQDKFISIQLDSQSSSFTINGDKMVCGRTSIEWLQKIREITGLDFRVRANIIPNQKFNEWVQFLDSSNLLKFGYNLASFNKYSKQPIMVSINGRPPPSFRNHGTYQAAPSGIGFKGFPGF